MVGNSATDIKTARAAGLPVIAVDFGYADAPVAELGPDRVISRFDELAAACAALLGVWVPHWSMNSPEFLLLVEQPGWSPVAFQCWLEDA